MNMSRNTAAGKGRAATLNNKTNQFNVADLSAKGPTITPDTSESGSVTSSTHVLASFLADYTFNMRKHTSKRGKRRNAVDLFTSSTSTIQNAIKDEYDAVIFDENYVDKTDIEIHLYAAKCTLDEFFNAQGSITDMSEYLPNTLHEEGYPTPQAHIFSLIESYIFNQFSTFLQDLNCIQSLMVAAWIDDSISKIEQVCPNVKLCSIWHSEYSKLISKFLENGVRSKMKHMLTIMMERWSDNNHIAEFENRFIADLAFVLDEHIRIANGFENDSFISSTVVVANEVVSSMVSEKMIDLCTKWMSIGTNRMCFIVNDSSELSDLLEQRNKIYASNHDSNDMANRAIQDLHDLSLCAINLLSERMMFDLQHSAATLVTVGNPDWECDDKGSTVTASLATYRPMLVRVYNWLSLSKYFPTILKNALNLTLQSYMESFFSNTMTYGVTNPAVVAANLSRDYLSLVAFFNGSLFEQHQGKDGFYSSCEVNQRLQVIQCIARLINPEVAPSELEDDAAQLLTLTSDEIDDDSTAVILHIAGLRSNHCGEKPTDWLHMIKALEQSTKDNRQQMNHKINLPDLRNSMYTCKMQQNHHFNNEMIQRRISSVLSFSGDSKAVLGKLIRTQARKVIGIEKENSEN